MQVHVYHGDSIRLFAQLFQARNAAAYNRLIERNERELIEAFEFIKSGRDESFNWLLDRKHFEVAAFANAVRGDKKAFVWLMQNKSIFWAATANAVNKDKDAMLWLKRNNFLVYAALAEAIIEFNKFNNEDFAGYYKSPF
ncbi:MAG: hypothetical protein LW750_00635 [Bacteroidetes bacterium]|jgi:hypothetical protein|nr:hypothetical protein [Bacteroidota bacterium]